MKGFFKLYSILSVSFVFLIFALIAIYPSEFLSFMSEVFNLIASDTQKLPDIFQLDLPRVETLFTYLFTGYLFNIVVNIIIAVFAYLTEDKFNASVTRYALIINVVFFFIVVYSAKLIVEGGYKSIRRIFTRRPSA